MGIKIKSKKSKEVIANHDKSESPSSILDLTSMAKSFGFETDELKEISSNVLKMLNTSKMTDKREINRALFIGAMLNAIINHEKSSFEHKKPVITKLLTFLTKLYRQNKEIEQFYHNTLLMVADKVPSMEDFDVLNKIITSLKNKKKPDTLLKKYFALKMSCNEKIVQKYPELIICIENMLSRDNLVALIESLKNIEYANELHPIWPSLILHLSKNPDSMIYFWTSFFGKDNIYCKTNELKATLLRALKHILTLENKKIFKCVFSKETWSVIIETSRKNHPLKDTHKQLFIFIQNYKFTSIQAFNILKICIGLLQSFPQIISLTHFVSPFIHALDKNGLDKCMKELYKNLSGIPNQKTYEVLNFAYLLIKLKNFSYFDLELEFIYSCINAILSSSPSLHSEKMINLYLQSLVFCEKPFKENKDYKFYKTLLEKIVKKNIEILSSRQEDPSIQNSISQFNILLTTSKKLFSVIKSFDGQADGKEAQEIFSKLMFGTSSYQIYQLDLLFPQLEDIYESAKLVFSSNKKSELYWFDILIDIMLQLLLIPSSSVHNLVKHLIEISLKHFHVSTWELVLSRLKSPDISTSDQEEPDTFENDPIPTKIKKLEDNNSLKQLINNNFNNKDGDINLNQADPKLLERFDEMITKQISLGKDNANTKKDKEQMQKCTKIFQSRIISCLEIMAKQELSDILKLQFSFKILKLCNNIFSNDKSSLDKLESIVNSLVSSKNKKMIDPSIDSFNQIFKKYTTAASKLPSVKLSAQWARWLVFLLKSIKLIDKKDYENFVKNCRNFLKIIFEKILTVKKEFANPLFFGIINSSLPELLSSVKLLNIFVQYLPKCKGSMKKIPTLIRIFNSIVLSTRVEAPKIVDIYSKIFDPHFLSSLQIDANSVIPIIIIGLKNYIKQNNSHSAEFMIQLQNLISWKDLNSSNKNSLTATIEYVDSLKPKTG